MIKKIFSVLIALTLILILIIGIAACSPTDTSDNQNQMPNIEQDDPRDTSDVADTNVGTTLVSISKEASEKLKDMIADGDYSEEVFLRVAPVRGGG